MSQTFEQWFRDNLPPEYAERAIENTRKQNPDFLGHASTDVPEKENVLSCGFSWERSPERGEFWSHVDAKLAGVVDNLPCLPPLSVDPGCSADLPVPIDVPHPDYYNSREAYEDAMAILAKHAEAVGFDQLGGGFEAGGRRYDVKIQRRVDPSQPNPGF